MHTATPSVLTPSQTPTSTTLTDTTCPSPTESDLTVAPQPVAHSDRRQQPAADHRLRSEDAMAGLIVGAILTLAFAALIVSMVVVNVWTMQSAS